MRAIQIDRYGGRDQLRLVEKELPAPGKGEVAIDIHAASVNPIDWKLREGSLKLIHPLKFPAILGFDLSGVVRAVGEGVTDFKAGDEVYSRSNRGAGESYAESIVLDGSVVAHKPKKLSHQEAAGLPLAGLTALQALRDKAGLTAGASVLVNGASGGVGILGVQIAKALGASRVVGVCSEKNADFVLEQGADAVIDYRTADPLAVGTSYNVVLDAVASLDFGRAKRVLEPKGTLVTTVPNGSVILALAVGNLFSPKKARFISVASSGKDLAYLASIADEGRLRCPIDSTFALEDIAAAHERSESGRVRGKVIIRVA